MSNKYKSSATIIPLKQAVGKVIAHDITEIRPGQFKGPAFKKGHIVQKKDLPHLRRLGKENLFALNIGPDEVHEDEAAIKLANALAGPGVVAEVVLKMLGPLIEIPEGRIRHAQAPLCENIFRAARPGEDQLEFRVEYEYLPSGYYRWATGSALGDALSHHSWEIVGIQHAGFVLQQHAFDRFDGGLPGDP